MSKMKFWKQFLSASLAVSVAFTGIPYQALAAEPEEQPEQKMIANFTFDGEDPYDGEGAKGQLAGYELVSHGEGKALQFSGRSNGWLNVTKEDGSPLLKGKESITISYETYGNQWGFFIAPNAEKQDYRGENYIGLFENDTVERYSGGRDNPTSSKIVGDATADWTQVDVVVEENQTTLYLNKVLVGEAPTPSTTTLSDIIGEEGGIFQIGKANWNNGEYSNGQIDNFKVYDGALTAGQIEGTEEITQELLADFSFDSMEEGFRGAGAVAEDVGVRKYSAEGEADNYALNLNGMNSWMNVTDEEGNPLLTGLSEMTISYDSYVRGSGTNWVFYAAPNSNAQGDAETYIGVIDKTTGFKLERFLDGRPENEKETNITSAIQGWKHVDVVLDEDKSTVYINKAKVAEATSEYQLADILGESSILQIGKANWGSGEFCNGMLDNLQIYNYAKTEEEITQTPEAVSEAALAVYDFADFRLSASGDSLMDGRDRELKLIAAGSGTKPSLVEDASRGTVLKLNESDYNNRAFALLPENPFEGQDIEDGLTLNFWTQTTGTAGGARCLIDFEVAPATTGRAGTFAVNQQMIYWNTTDQNSKYIDFNIGELGLSAKNEWKMVTIAVTKSGLRVYCDGKEISVPISDSDGSMDYERMISDLAGGLLEQGQKSNVRLGASLATYWTCAGALLDDISFYGKALSEDEVIALYNETKVKVPLESITISGEAAVDEGKTISLTAALVPSNTTEKHLTWSSSDPNVLTVDKDGVVTGISGGTATVTAEADGVVSNSLEITVIPSVKALEPGYYLTVYSTENDFYAYAANVEQETQSVYMAVSRDGKSFEVLNSGGGVIFSKNTGGTLRVTEPRITKDESGFTVTAPDNTASRGIHVFTSEDGVHYYDDTLVSASSLGQRAASLDKASFSLLLDGKNILDTDETVTLGNAIPLTEEEYTYIVNKLGTVRNNGLEELSDLEVESQEELVQKLASDYASVNATYTDGSTQKFTVDWSDALSEIDMSKPGTYTLTGKVIQTKYVNKLKELNSSTLPEDDPENVNPDDPDNYDEETGTTYYDATKFVEGMADPCIYWDEQTGYYYMTGSYFPEDGDAIDGNDNTQQYDRVVLRRSRTLEGLQSRENQVTIWKAGNQGYYDGDSYAARGYRYIWAPEIHRVGDYWVVYFTESQSSSDLFGIYCHALILPGDQDPYETALTSADQESQWTDYRVNKASDVTDSLDSLGKSFCLDMTYFKDEVDGKSYVIWAGKPTASYQGSSTDLFIAEVSEEQPWVVTSAATRLTCSEYGWERIRYCVNEGPTVLQKDGNIFLCYSVSGTGSEYAIGMCSAKGGEDLLDIENWTKSPYPLLTSRDVDGEEGPGHNSFTVDQDGNAIFVYHARPTSHNYRKCGCDENGNNSSYNSEPLNDPCRHARLKRVHWAADGTPILKMTYEEELLEEYSTVELKVTKTMQEVLLTELQLTPPTKLAYTVGEDLDTAGMEVKALYSDGSEKILTGGYEITGFDSSKAAQSQEVTVSYTEQGVKKTASFTVTIERAVVTEDDLIASFDFDGEEGLKGAGAVAVVNGTASYEDSFAGSGKAMNIGDSNWLNVTKEDGTPLLKGLESITISYDSKATSTGSGWVFFAAPNTTAQQYKKEHYLGIMDKAASITVERYNNSTDRPGNNIEASGTSQWKHVDLVVEEDKTTLYINGIQAGEQTSAYKLSSILGSAGGILQIGKGNWENGEYYYGLIDNLKIYRGAKTAEQLAFKDADVVEKVKEALAIPNVDDVRGNITLLDTLEGATITWTSSNETVITSRPTENEDYADTPAGVVTRGDKDQKVILTATIQKGTERAVKEFEVTVKAKAKELKEEDFTAYLFGSFTGTEGRATDEQIYFAASTDGYNYVDLNDCLPVLQSNVGEKGVRDPYIIRSAEGDRFYLIATDLSIYHRGGWGNAKATTTGSRDLIIWESTDLVEWSEPRAVTVAGPNAGCAWAPEAIYDEKTGEYVVYFAANDMTDDIGDGVLQIYYVKTRDFVNFTEAQEYITRGASQSIIDTTMIKNDEDGYYYRASADGQITLERSKDLFGTWETVTNLNSLSLGGDMTGKKLEGPELFKFNKKDWVDGKPTYGLYTDQYAEGKGYLPVITTDLNDRDNSNQSWKKLTDAEYTFDSLKKRHGTILNLTQEEYERVMKAYYKELPDIDEEPQETPVLSYNFEDGIMKDVSGNDRDGKLFGNAVIVEDGEKGGKVLKLDGTTNTYAELPQGFFDNRNTFSISMDVKAESVSGNYFTFTFGVDENKYLFLKASDNTSRVSMTRAGYGSEQTASGASGTILNRWVKFTIVLDSQEQRLKLYLDGQKIGEKRTVLKTAALGEDLVSYLGKSFYSKDAYFKGCFDNIEVYNRALSDEEIAESVNEKVTVTYTASEGGRIEGTAVQTIVKGQSATEVTAVAEEGYEFVKWSDGVTTASRTDSQVQADVTYEAIFRKQEGPEPVETVTVEYLAGTGGRIEGTAVQTIVKGQSTTEVTAAALEGYTFHKWSDGVVTATRKDSNVLESKKVTAEFTKNQVTKPEPETPDAASVKLNVKKKIAIGVKEKVQLKATVLPAGASQKVTWKSSKKSVVKVSKNGKITGKKRGTATITATTVNGKKVTCRVTVKKAPKKISLKTKAKTKILKKGKTWKLNLVYPKKTTSYKVTFKSSKKAVATVNAKGKIKAKKKGTAIITAKTFNGKKVRIKIIVR